jgi:hypothetical protein
MAAASTAAMTREYEATRQALVDRYANSLRAAALTLKNLRGNVAEVEQDRDRLLRESAPVLRREQAADFASVSLSRVDQIIGGA